jgi:hypothetical protein
MRSTLVVALLVALPALAQVQLTVQLPNISFPAPPPLVVVQPGVQVVEESNDEVFFVDGWYWARRDAAWFRTRDHSGGWVVVPAREVPVTLVRIPLGHYRHYRHGKHRGSTTVVVDPPGRGKVKVKVKHHGH